MFEPTPGKLLPDLSPREELVLLARTLWREGYNDHLAGHITYNLGDGTLLCNPWLLTWAEFRPQDVIEKCWGDIPAAELRQMCSGNAAALYRHPLPDVVLPLDS